MTRKVTLNIPEECFEELRSLGEFYKQDVKKTILEIIEAVSSKSSLLTYLCGEYKVPVNPRMVLGHMFSAAQSMMYVANEVLEKLGVKGLFTLEDFSFNIDERRFNFVFDCLSGSNLLIDYFDIQVEPGSIWVTTYLSISAEETDAEALSKLKEAVEDVSEPAAFADCEDFSVKIEEDEAIYTLKVDYMTDDWDYLPSIKHVVKLVKDIFKKAGIREK
ncbi:MAG: hypothetical protein QXL10_05810 [Candidatus Bathyarchaeia archaeon]